MFHSRRFNTKEDFSAAMFIKRRKRLIEVVMFIYSKPTSTVTFIL